MFSNFIIRMLLTVGIFILVDFYTHQAFRQIFGKKDWVKKTFFAIHGVLYATLLFFILSFVAGWQLPREYFFWFLTIALTLFIPKAIIAVFLLAEDVSRLGRWVFGWFQRQMSKPEPLPDTGNNKISRAKFISQTATVLAGVPFAGMVYGIVKGRYNYTLHRVQVPIKNLPKAFQGLTITQISDIHVGSFDDKEAVLRGIDMVNEQESDLIFFTGDLINNRVEELNGYEEMFAQLKAQQGVFSTLGNHDYGDYEKWSSEEAKAAHFEKVLQAHKDMGWRLLKNENHLIQRGDDQLAIIGIENWGGNGFTKYGKLNEAVIGTEASQVKLLLSHDPSHWNAQVRKEYPDIDLMFSGHTHGMQFGLEIPSLNIKWSPSQYRYEQWAGLYRNPEHSQHLYVNRGFGYLAFMGRTGIMPEVTVLELVSA